MSFEILEVLSCMTAYVKGQVGQSISAAKAPGGGLQPLLVQRLR